MPVSPDALAADPEIVDALGVCNIEVNVGPEEPAWFTVDGIPAVRQIGEDGAGGIFALLPPSQRVLFVSSEGQAGIIADDLEAFIQLIVAYPYWHSILSFSGNGQLAEMRRAEVLREMFSLAEPADLLDALHHAVSTSDVVVRPPDGTPFTTLFGKFTIDNNPFLRDAT
jgi:hypothetical protein